MISDRTCDQNIILRPPRPLAGDFPLRGTVSHSPGDFELLNRGDVTTADCLSVFHSGSLCGRHVTPTLTAPFCQRLSGWLGPSCRLCSAERSTGPVRAEDVHRWGGSLRAERPLVSLGRSTCDRACWGRLRSPSASAERSGSLAVRRLAGARRLCDGPRCDPLTGPKYRHLDPHHG